MHWAQSAEMHIWGGHVLDLLLASGWRRHGGPRLGAVPHSMALYSCIPMLLQIGLYLADWAYNTLKTQ